MYVKKFTSFCQVLKMHAQENWFLLLRHGVLSTSLVGQLAIYSDSTLLSACNRRLLQSGPTLTTQGAGFTTQTVDTLLTW